MHLTHFIVYTLAIGPNGAALNQMLGWCPRNVVWPSVETKARFQRQ
jgi:hypothetical protein